MTHTLCKLMVPFLEIFWLWGMSGGVAGLSLGHKIIEYVGKCLTYPKGDANQVTLVPIYPTQINGNGNQKTATENVNCKR